MVFMYLDTNLGSVCFGSLKSRVFEASRMCRDSRRAQVAPPTISGICSFYRQIQYSLHDLVLRLVFWVNRMQAY